MIYSLNEIETLARKAARGSGMSWGLAEEAGKAVRWLSDNGFSGPWLLADLLRQNDRRPYPDLAPRYSDGVWRARSGALCPIVAGALICDQADDLRNGSALRLQDVAVPLLLAPFAYQASRTAQVTLALEWPGASLVVGSHGLSVDKEEAAPDMADVRSVALFPVDERSSESVRTNSGRYVTPETLRALESFAIRTYAPATEASRARAGADKEGD